MLKEDRIKGIENYVIKHENVSINTLCSLFDVSKNTIRRDISELERKGVIKKIYGGITLKNKTSTVPFQQREIKHKETKKIIAKAASNLVENGDIIYIDSGTTTMHMIPFLSDKKNENIITNNVNVIVNSFPYKNLNILSTGGSLSRNTNSLIGVESINFLKNYNISKCFMASTGVSIKKGVTNSSSFEYEIKRTVVKQSSKIILLADSSKLGMASLMTYCNLEDIDTFITNEPLSNDYLDFFNKNNIELIISDNL
ncbi:DeoR/GlpR family DNA-binding transcription regulator [Clostridium tetani]|uniref:DeoR/GlpR family DNA-binding transcription regulator n=1 Tax=Clostridium tetani TaxID=1513 RepID=UPI000627FD4D|nr:DeoR/GlpR family DNA-binding transcription regulator [Clostridium tetani]